MIVNCDMLDVKFYPTIFTLHVDNSLEFTIVQSLTLQKNYFD